ncbi:MAG TPA: class I SAM-dependent methyltransferase [Jatrophihabitantaceae bacterium]|nr:class I SAM-dependent methyltransferase [Jatrophihabitantaceae bacterium]
MIARLYAFMYDRIGRGSEAAGLQRERVALLAQARGNTVEIGAGTGLNLDHYPPTVTHLTLVEPDRHMRKRLRQRVAQIRPDAAVLDARAESLPLPDASVDTVVVTFVLCSVADQNAALAEITRVLRPGGQLLFLEHVRDTDPQIADKQDHAPFLYSWIGCHPNRATLEAITHSPLSVVNVRHGQVPKAPVIERPMVVGVAESKEHTG